VVNTISTNGYGNGPEWVATIPSGALALVTNGGANSDNIAVVSASKGAPVAVINAEALLDTQPACNNAGSCRNPGGIAINPCPALSPPTAPCAFTGDGSGRTFAYVSNPATNSTDTASVSVIDIAAGLTDPTNLQGQTIVSTVFLPAGAQPHQLSVSPDGSTLWVVDATGPVWVIDTAKAVTSPNTAVFKISPPGTPIGVAAVSPTVAWVTLSGPSEVVGVDTTNPGVFGCLPVSAGSFPCLLLGTPVGITFLQFDPSLVWVVEDSLDAVLFYDGFSLNYGGITGLNNPAAIAISPDGSMALVTNTGDNTVSVIDVNSAYSRLFNLTGSLVVLATLATDSEPVGIAFQNSFTFLPGEPVTPLNGVTGGFGLTGINASLVGSVNWSFGNGARLTTSALNTNYAYAAPGTYDAKVTVFNKSGGTLLTKTIPVQVQSPLQAIRSASVLTQRLLLPSSEQTSLQHDLGAAYNALLAGNRSGALSSVGLYVNQLNNILPKPPGVLAVLDEAKAIGTSLNQSCALCLGIGNLAPQSGSSAVDQAVTFTATWTVPDGKSWRSLQHVDLRLVANSANGDSDATPLPIALWARFTVGDASGSTPSTFELLDQNENVVGVGDPGGTGVIETNTAKLYLANSSFQGSGPTGPSVTVNFAVSFKAAAIAKEHGAQPYQSQLLASDALQGGAGPGAARPLDGPAGS
jgi:PKD repeat protein